MRTLVVLDAPSNLSLRPSAPGTVPGCHKLAGALREQRGVQRPGAQEGGVVMPPRYDRGDCSIQLGASPALRRIGR